MLIGKNAQNNHNANRLSQWVQQVEKTQDNNYDLTVRCMAYIIYTSINSKKVRYSLYIYTMAIVVFIRQLSTLCVCVCVCVCSLALKWCLDWHVG